MRIEKILPSPSGQNSASKILSYLRKQGLYWFLLKSFSNVKICEKIHSEKNDLTIVLNA